MNASSLVVQEGRGFSPWSEPPRLGRTPHSRTQVPQRLLMRLYAAGDCDPHLSSTDSQKCGAGSDPSVPILASLRPPVPPTPAPSASGSAANRNRGIAFEAPHRRPPFHAARQQGSWHAACEPARSRCALAGAQPRDHQGGFVPANLFDPSSLSLARAQSARRLGRARKGGFNWPTPGPCAHAPLGAICAVHFSAGIA